MHYRNQLRSTRERIIAAEVRKLELRQAQQQHGSPQQAVPALRPRAAARGYLG